MFIPTRTPFLVLYTAIRLSSTLAFSAPRQAVGEHLMPVGEGAADGRSTREEGTQGDPGAELKE